MDDGDAAEMWEIESERRRAGGLPAANLPKWDLDRSGEAHELIEDAADQLRGMGLEGAAPWRFLAWASFDNLRAEQCGCHAAEDLRRLRDMLDRHLAALGEPAQ